MISGNTATCTMGDAPPCNAAIGMSGTAIEESFSHGGGSVPVECLCTAAVGNQAIDRFVHQED